MVLLAVESENGAVLNYRLEKSQITVGSSSKNDVVVRSPAVADRHLVMHRNGDVFTFVTVDRQTVVLNGERRSRGVLYPGDRIRLGPMTLVFRGSETGEVVVLPEGVPPEAERGAVFSSPGRRAAVDVSLRPGRLRGDSLGARGGFGDAAQRLLPEGHRADQGRASRR